MALLTAAEYPAIRAAIDVSLDAVALPDAMIALSIYAPAAEAEVLRQDPAAESRTGDALRRSRDAAVFYAAERLVLRLPQIIREQVSADQGYQRQFPDPAALAADLRRRGDEAIALAMGAAAIARIYPVAFAAAAGRRGW